MRGFITSPKAAEVYDFLRRVGPAPFPALVVALGLRADRLAKALRHLHGGGYAYPVRQGSIEFWCPFQSLPPGTGQETLAWFAARLEEAGGTYEKGLAKFPKGQEMPVIVNGDEVQVGWYICCLADLKEKPLRECFRKKSTAGGAGKT